MSGQVDLADGRIEDLSSGSALDQILIRLVVVLNLGNTATDGALIWRDLKASKCVTCLVLRLIRDEHASVHVRLDWLPKDRNFKVLAIDVKGLPCCSEALQCVSASSAELRVTLGA